MVESILSFVAIILLVVLEVKVLYVKYSDGFIYGLLYWAAIFIIIMLMDTIAGYTVV